MLYYRYHGKILTILPIWVCLRDPCATPNQFAPQTLSQSLAIQGFGRAGSLFTFPRKGTETSPACRLWRSVQLLLTFPRKGTETGPSECRILTVPFDHYLPFPVRGRKLRPRFLLRHFVRDYYLPFPARGRKHDFVGWQLVLDEGIIIYISPQGDGNPDYSG